MALLALQRATPNLPFQLITPGRTLLKRGPLLQVERSGTPVEREFLLFSDCMIWLAAAEVLGQSWDWSWSGSGSAGSGAGVTQSNHNTPVGSKFSAERPPMTRTRSKSDADVSAQQIEAQSLHSRDDSRSRDTGGNSLPVTPQRSSKSVLPSGSPPPVPNMAKRRYSVDDKWTYKGRIELVDIQVIVGSALEDERRFEILSPEGSFVLYASQSSHMSKSSIGLTCV
jgi:FYVE/RhoGEF/PH domain-containing protein 5/6